MRKNNLVVTDKGLHREYVGLYHMDKNCLMYKHIYLTVCAAAGLDFQQNPMQRVHMYVNYRYGIEPKRLTITKDFEEFMKMDKTTFFEKLDEIKAVIDEDVKDEVDEWTLDQYTMEKKKKKGFWVYLSGCRLEIASTEK